MEEMASLTYHVCVTKHVFKVRYTHIRKYMLNITIGYMQESKVSMSERERERTAVFPEGGAEEDDVLALDLGTLGNLQRREP